MSKLKAQSALQKLIESQKNPNANEDGYFRRKRLAKKERPFEPKKLVQQQQRLKEKKKNENIIYLKKTMRVTPSEEKIHEMVC